MISKVGRHLQEVQGFAQCPRCSENCTFSRCEYYHPSVSPELLNLLLLDSESDSPLLLLPEDVDDWCVACSRRNSRNSWRSFFSPHLTMTANQRRKLTSNPGTASQLSSWTRVVAYSRSSLLTAPSMMSVIFPSRALLVGTLAGSVVITTLRKDFSVSLRSVGIVTFDVSGQVPSSLGTSQSRCRTKTSSISSPISSSIMSNLWSKSPGGKCRFSAMESLMICQGISTSSNRAHFAVT